MNWIAVAAILGAGTLAAFTDWLFMGVLFHAEYNRYPEVWWPGLREGKEMAAIIWSSAIGYVMTAAITRSDSWFYHATMAGFFLLPLTTMSMCPAIGPIAILPPDSAGNVGGMPCPFGMWQATHVLP